MPIVTAQDLTDWLDSVGLSDIPGVKATALDNAIAEAQRHCGRSFAYLPEDGGADVARTFTGDDTPTLIIDDLLTLTSLSVAGSATGSGSYRPEKAGSGPYIYVTRLSSDLLDVNGNPAGSALGVWGAGSTITITGQWGYAPTTPESVTEAVCMLATVRLLSTREWLSAGHASLNVGAVSRTFSPDMLKAKRAEALTLLRGFRRNEQEPHL